MTHKTYSKNKTIHNVHKHVIQNKIKNIVHFISLCRNRRTLPARPRQKQ